MVKQKNKFSILMVLFMTALFFFVCSFSLLPVKAAANGTVQLQFSLNSNHDSPMGAIYWIYKDVNYNTSAGKGFVVDSTGAGRVVDLYNKNQYTVTGNLSSTNTYRNADMFNSVVVKNSSGQTSGEYTWAVLYGNYWYCRTPSTTISLPAGTYYLKEYKSTPTELYLANPGNNQSFVVSESQNTVVTVSAPSSAKLSVSMKYSSQYSPEGTMYWVYTDSSATTSAGKGIMIDASGIGHSVASFSDSTYTVTSKTVRFTDCPDAELYSDVTIQNNSGFIVGTYPLARHVGNYWYCLNTSKTVCLLPSTYYVKEMLGYYGNLYHETSASFYGSSSSSRIKSATLTAGTTKSLLFNDDTGYVVLNYEGDNDYNPEGMLYWLYHDDATRSNASEGFLIDANGAGHLIDTYNRNNSSYSFTHTAPDAKGVCRDITVTYRTSSSTRTYHYDWGVISNNYIYCARTETCLRLSPGSYFAYESIGSQTGYEPDTTYHPFTVSAGETTVLDATDGIEGISIHQNPQIVIDTSNTIVKTSKTVNGDRIHFIRVWDAPFTGIHPSDNTETYFDQTGGTDAILLESNGHFALVDVGQTYNVPVDSSSHHSIDTANAVVNYLQNYGVEKLDYIVISHWHADHMGNLINLINNCTTKGIEIDSVLARYWLDGNVDGDTTSTLISPYTINNVKNVLNRYQIEHQVVRDDDILYLGNMKLTVYIPNDAVVLQSVKNVPSDIYITENINCIGLLLEVNGHTAFLSGDIDNMYRAENGESVQSKYDINTYFGDEAWFAQNDTATLSNVEIFKAGHHGSWSSNSYDYVQMLNPLVTIITGSTLDSQARASFRQTRCGTAYETEGGNIFRTYQSQNGVVFDLSYAGQIRVNNTYQNPSRIMSVLYGDANNDGSVDSDDAMLVLQYYVGLISDNSINMVNADVNNDNIIDSDDAMLILQYYAGLIPQLPVHS